VEMEVTKSLKQESRHFSDERFKKNMKYQTTKKQCQKKIDESNKVCEHCGRKPVPIKTFDDFGNIYYLAGCRHGGDWGHFTVGVSKDIYDLAEKLVLDNSLYLGINNIFGGKSDDFGADFRKAVRRACDILEEIERMKNGKPRYSKKDLARIYEYLEEGVRENCQ